MGWWQHIFRNFLSVLPSPHRPSLFIVSTGVSKRFVVEYYTPFSLLPSERGRSRTIFFSFPNLVNTVPFHCTPPSSSATVFSTFRLAGSAELAGEAASGLLSLEALRVPDSLSTTGAAQWHKND